MKAVEQLPRMRFFSTSLLFIYEGDPVAPKRVTVKLIDFAHTMSLDDLEEAIQREAAELKEAGRGDAGSVMPSDALDYCEKVVRESKEKHKGVLEKPGYWRGPDLGLQRGLRSAAEVMEQIMYREQAMEARSETRTVLKKSSFEYEKAAADPPVFKERGGG